MATRKTYLFTAALIAVALLITVIGFLPLGGDSKGPAFAPNGRPGQHDLNRIVEAFVKESNADRILRYGSPDARIFNGNQERDSDTPEEWSSVLAEQHRQLYAVYRGGEKDLPASTGIRLEPRDFTIAIQVGESGGKVFQSWSIAVSDGRATEVVITDLAYPGYFYSMAPLPSLQRDYDRYLVLPPKDALPKPPSAHALSTRTRDSKVDRLLSRLKAHDARGLISLADFQKAPCGYEEGIPICPHDQPDVTVIDALAWLGPGRGLAGPYFELRGRSSIGELLTTLAKQVIAVKAIVDVPTDYEPTIGHHIQADHAIVLVTQRGPYWWEPVGLLERDGRIVSVMEGQTFEAMYPWRFIVPPPEGTWLYRPVRYVLAPPAGIADLNASRRSGNSVIDSFIDALNSNDTSTVLRLTDTSREFPCVELQPGAIPRGNEGLRCLPGEASGTPVRALPVWGCGGFAYQRAETALPALERGGAEAIDWVLYAVVDDDGLFALLTPAGQLSSLDAIAVAFTERGVNALYRSCYAVTDSPPTKNGMPWPVRTASFLLPPPSN